MTPAAPAAHDEGETVGGLALVVRELFGPLGLTVTEAEEEPDNAGYGAVLARVHGAATVDGIDSVEAVVRIRTGKITPTKVGLFVTHWRRAADGTTGPYDADDGADVLLVTVAEDARSGDDPARGVLVFGRATLLARGIVGRDGTGGRRGFRVYPPWSQTAPGQATRTQRWQLEHFVPLPLGAGDLDRARRLLVL